ncbi:MAG: amino acid adenylation domain-containing protein, partial [Proteobacteria bacterium]|nr:amino acid adenylation domain-containing protein [Pseudomonadota bacterium]
PSNLVTARSTLKDRARDDAARPFDLGVDPPIRARLLRFEGARAGIVLTVHHIAVDGHSMPILMKDLSTLYREALAGNSGASELPALPFSYADWTDWIVGVRAGQAEAVQYAAQALTGAPELLALPLDRPRPSRRDHRGGVAEFAVSAELETRIDELSRRLGTTPFAVLASAYALLLGRLSGDEDVVLGVPVAGRNREETQDLIGFFADTAVLRVRLDDEADGTVLVGRVHGDLARVLSDPVPFDALVEDMDLRRDTSHGPVFQAMIAQNEEDTALDYFGDAKAEALLVHPGTAKFDLQLQILRHGGALRCALEYASDVFDHATAVSFSSRYLRVLDWLSRGGVGGVSSVPLIGLEERDWLLRGVNETARDYGAAEPVHRRIEAMAASCPSAAAVRFEGVEVSYGDLNDRANALARRLLRAGVGPESCVGVALERSVELVVALVAVLKAGGGYLPLDLELPSDRLSFMIEDAGAAVVVTRAGLLDRLPAHGGRVVTVDGVGRRARGGSGNLDVAVRPENLAYVIYTSGSTGRPKGVMNAHSGLWNRLRWMQETFPIGAGDRVLQKTPFTFDVSVWEFFWPLMEGACLVVSRPGGHRDPDYLAGLLGDEAITVAHFVPSMLQAFLGHGPSASALGSCEALRYVVCSGEALAPSLVGRFRDHAPAGAVLHNLYGPTEAAIDVSHWPCVGEPADPLPIGYAIANTSLYVLDGALEPVPVGVVGELWIGGVQVSRGYLGRPGLTCESFLADPHGGVAGARMYRTGDLARRLAGGALTYLGRIDHQVKLRGFRIELGEIESVLLRHGSVGSAAVVLREDRAGDPRIVAYVVADGGVAPADLGDHLRSMLADHMVPSDIVVLEALPVTANGKLDRAALPAPLGVGAGAGGSGAGGQARGPEEEVACAVFAGVLGREEVGAEDNFFALGGHSLLAVQAVGRLRTALDVELPANAVLAAPTPREIAARIRGARRVKRSALPLPEFDAPRMATAAETRLWFLQRRDPEDTSYNMTGVIDLEDGVDLEALGRALAAVRRRHQTLHSRFELRGDAVWAVPDPGAISPSTVEGPLSKETAEAVAREEAATPFDLAIAPPSRARLLRLVDGRACMVLSFHHVGADARSVSVFGRDLDAAYASAVADASLRVEDLKARLPEPVADPLRGETLGAAGIDFDAALERWRLRLEGAPAGLDLPRDGSVRDRGVIETKLHVDAALRRRLSRRAVAGQATVFMVLHAALAALLSRLSGQGDVVIGTPVDLRGDPDLADTIGMLLNSVPLRLQIDAETRGADLVALSRETVLTALADAAVPLERIVAVADPDRQNTRAPLFQVLLTNHAPHLSGLSLGGSVRDMRVAPQTEAKMDLVVLCADNGAEIDLTIESAAGLFDEAGARRFAAMLACSLAAIVDRPDMPVRTIPLLDEEAAAAETRGADVVDTRPAPDGTVPDLFRLAARAYPSEIAIEDVDGRALDYRALDELTDRIAGALVAQNVRRGDRVGLRMGRGLDQIAAMLGVLKAGAAYVPLDPEQPEPRLEGMAEDAGIRVVVTDLANQAAMPGGVSFSLLARSEAKAPRAQITGADTAYVMFTSGSTGRPKGIAIPHRAVLRLAIDPGFADFQPGKRVAQVATTAFDAATYEIWCALLNGATTVVIDRAATYEPEALAAAFSAARVRSTFLTASVFNRTARAETDAFSGFEEVMFGGEAADAGAVRAALARWPEVRFINGYGPTETTTFAACHAVDAVALEDLTVPIGRPIRATSLYVLDEFLVPVPRGVSGELFIGGAGLADGYVADPIRTASSFVADPFCGIAGARMYRTGDLVRRNSSGAVVYLGRIDRQIKLRGFRIEPGEIEVKLSGLLGDNSDVVVDARETEDDRALFAWVIGRRVDATEERRLRAGLSAQLPGWMLPRRIVGIDAPPLTPNGKLDRGALKVPGVLSGAVIAEPSGSDLPDSETERLLAELWSDLLDGAAIRRSDSFFSAGGHSLLGVRLVMRVQKAFGVDLPLRAVFETPVLSSMAAVIEALQGTGAPASAEALSAKLRLDDSRPVSANQARLALMDRIDGSGVAYTIPVAILVDGPIDPDALKTALQALVLR